MAIELNEKPVQTERYMGSHPVSSAIGGVALGGLAGLALAETPLSFYADRLEDGKKMGGLAKMGKFFESGTFMAKSTLVLMFAVPAAFVGWAFYEGSKRERAQFDALKGERDEARAQLGQAAQVIQAIESEKQALSGEVSQHRKRFADGLKSHAEHGGHANHVAEQAIAAESAEKSL